jgi:FKBP-type peptidyl-prolyl cis-trans isomerase 2
MTISAERDAMPDLSPQAQERARATIVVAEVFEANADEIAAAVADVAEGHVLVAVVDGEHEFAGIHHVSTDELVETVPSLEAGGGWAMVFSAGADADHVRRRTAEMASIARQRIDAIDRIIRRRGG